MVIQYGRSASTYSTSSQEAKASGRDPGAPGHGSSPGAPGPKPRTRVFAHSGNDPLADAGTEHGAIVPAASSRLSRVLTCPETLHHHSPGMNGTLGPRARWARSDRAFAAYPQSLRSFRYSTTLPAQRPYAPRRMVMQGSRGKDGRGSPVPATEQTRLP